MTDAKYIFTYLFAIHTFPLMKYPSCLLSIFQLDFFNCLVLIVLYLFYTWIICQICNLEIFSLTVCLSFHPDRVFAKSCPFWWSPIYYDFSLLHHPFAVKSKKSLSNTASQRVSPLNTGVIYIEDSR